MQKTDMQCNPMIVIPVLDEQRELAASLSAVAGLPLIRRVMLMAGKADFDQLTVVSGIAQERVELALAGVGRLETCAAWHAQAHNGPILLLAPGCLPDRDFFAGLREQQIKADEILLWENRQAVLLGAALRPALQDHIAQAGSFRQLVNALAEMKASAPSQQPGHVGMTIRDAEDIRHAETALLSGLVKATEGWMALHINRKISLALTRCLMHTSVTPNHMSWVSMGLGLIGAAFFLSPAHSMQIWGALFFLAHSILDGCDGELARLKFMESRYGGILDFWSDNIVHIAVFAAMGVGWAAASPDSFWPWLCAGLAVGGTAVSASLIYFHTMHATKKAGPLYTSVSTSEQKSAVVRIADILSRRDFIYLVLLLALPGQTHWFLIMTAIGAPVYALLLIGIMLRDQV